MDTGNRGVNDPENRRWPAPVASHSARPSLPGEQRLTHCKGRDAVADHVPRPVQRELRIRPAAQYLIATLIRTTSRREPEEHEKHFHTVTPLSAAICRMGCGRTKSSPGYATAATVIRRRPLRPGRRRQDP